MFFYVLGTLFQKMNSDMLENLNIGGSEYLTDETLQALSQRKLPNLKEIWFSNCPNLELRESTLENLKNCPKLKKIGFEWTNLSGISTQYLLEFNEKISIFVYCQDFNWIVLPQKLKEMNLT